METTGSFGMRRGGAVVLLLTARGGVGWIPVETRATTTATTLLKSASTTIPFHKVDVRLLFVAEGGSEG